MNKDELRDLADDQKRTWRNGRLRAVERFVNVVGDKADWWRDRVVAGKAEAKTANKDIGQLSRMLKDLNIRKNLNLPREVERSRVPYEKEVIQKKLLAKGALDGLNEYARLVLYVVADTGLRPTEVVNLPEHAIRLNADIPHVKAAAGRTSAKDRRFRAGYSACGRCPRGA